MDRWEIARVDMGDEYVDQLLEVGWEPFAVCPETDERYGVIWFKRKKHEEPLTPEETHGR